MILGVGLVFFVAGALGAFFFDKVVLTWNYFVAQVLYFPQSYHDLKEENIILKQELEYARRTKEILRVQVDSLALQVKGRHDAARIYFKKTIEGDEKPKGQVTE